MRISLVIPTLGVGGSERQLIGLAEGLAQRGHDVEVVTFADPEGVKPDLQESEVDIVTLDPGTARTPLVQTPHLMARLARHWRRQRPDAVQAWLPQAQIVVLPVARSLGIPHRVLALRSMASAVSMNRMESAALRVAGASATVVTGNSQAVVFDAGWPVGRAPRVLIPNAVDIPASSADPSTQPPTGVVVANFTAIKGHSVLLKALGRLPQAPKMDLVGNGPQLPYLRSEARRLGLQNAVTFHTGVTDPWPFLLESQFFVLPSPSEGLPNAVMEAMAAGLPVLAFRVGGIPEIIDDGVSGILVDPRDVQGLADAIGRVAADSQWRLSAGAAARERMKDLSWDAMVQRNLDIMGGV